MEIQYPNYNAAAVQQPSLWGGQFGSWPLAANGGASVTNSYVRPAIGLPYPPPTAAEGGFTHNAVVLGFFRVIETLAQSIQSLLGRLLPGGPTADLGTAVPTGFAPTALPTVGSETESPGLLDKLQSGGTKILDLISKGFEIWNAIRSPIGAIKDIGSKVIAKVGGWLGKIF